jgi:uncharacterized protein
MTDEPTETAAPGNERTELALFPLQSVLFPDGLLGLKIFETRYLDLISRCMRSSQGFGVVAIRSGSEVRLPGGEPVELEPVGVLAEILEVDSPGSGILHVRCRGTKRFAAHEVAQQSDGLWTAQAEWLPADPVVAPGEALQACAQALVTAIDTLHAQGARPFLEPMRFDDAGWVANRWCEILPIPTEAKPRLMALDEPLIRLGLVDEFLRQNKVID